jgi:hypothetical protein
VIIALAIALAVPLVAANVFAYRWLRFLWITSRQQSRAMVALGAQLQELLREQRCESAGSTPSSGGMN